MRRSTLPILKTFLLERGFANGNYRPDCFWFDCRRYRQIAYAGARWRGFILTCILGIVGAVVGGWLATMFGIGGSISGFNLHSFPVAVVGAIVVLVIFRLLRRG